MLLDFIAKACNLDMNSILQLSTSSVVVEDLQQLNNCLCQMLNRISRLSLSLQATSHYACPGTRNVLIVTHCLRLYAVNCALCNTYSHLVCC
jgi:hypothetical protein